jgi:hypothetical protein
LFDCDPRTRLEIGMKITCCVVALFAGMIVASAVAQSLPQPLNLKLPPEPMPAQNAAPARSTSANSGAAFSAAAVDTANASTEPSLQLGVDYDNAQVDYDDAHGNVDYAQASARPKCDDASYGQPQVHGDMTVGVVGGNRVSGNYQAGTVNVTKAFGSCDHPTGGASISISVGQGNFNGRHSRRQGWSQ